MSTFMDFLETEFAAFKEKITNAFNAHTAAQLESAAAPVIEKVALAGAEGFLTGGPAGATAAAIAAATGSIGEIVESTVAVVAEQVAPSAASTIETTLAPVAEAAQTAITGTGTVAGIEDAAKSAGEAVLTQAIASELPPV